MTTVSGSKDPDKASGPIDPKSVSPDDPDFLEMQTIDQCLQAQQEFIKTGATLVGDALQVEQDIVTAVGTGPLYELGAGALEGLISQAGEGIEKVKELRAFAAKATEEAATAKRLTQKEK